MDEVTIREATVADVPGIQSVARTTWHAAYDDILGSDCVDSFVDDWYDASTVECGVADPETEYVVAVADTDDEPTVVGYSAAGPARDADEAPGRAELYSIYVTPQYWGDGVGSHMLDRVEESLRGRGFEVLYVTVLSENDVGLSFYERQGFELVDTSSFDMGPTTVRESHLRRPL